MCSAVDFEMLVSHSPPVFSHSPPSSFLSEYTSCRLGADTFSRFPRGSCRASAPSSLSFNINSINMPCLPKRPCLVIRPDESPNSSDEDPTSPTKLKKKVVFADDKGMSLTHVRVMREPSNVPPLWSFRFLAEVTHGISAEPEVERDQWEITFPQPASDYIEFRKKLNSGKVCLENVIVKDAEEVFIGTVKVSNLSFNKVVVVRLTFDNWTTSEDAFCNYVPTGVMNSTGPTYVLFDTFSFKIPLPPRSKKIEFCICFKCEDDEYWDNNAGSNYVIVKKIQPAPMIKSISCDDIYKKQRTPVQVTKKCADAVQAKLDFWSEFASWNHFENSNPYW